MNKYQVCVVGGAGHVGAPLSILLASRGLNTLVYDLNEAALRILASGKMPFLEEGGESLLNEVLPQGRLGFSSNSADLSGIPVIILTIGTPIDEFHNPKLSVLTDCVDGLLPYLNQDQVLILRSTVAPGTTEFLGRHLLAMGKPLDVAFCPERVVQGKAIEEIQTLPQIISGSSDRALQVARDIFSKITSQIVEATSAEAEFAKLICNAYRYIQFAATNQLYMMVESAGVDYISLLEKIKRGYPRMDGLLGPGFAAGPCLMKDTMQLFAFGRHNFTLGQLAMNINEGLPNYIVSSLATEHSLEGVPVGILGMAFKGNSDDIRDSLSYKLLKLLKFVGAKVLCSDEFVQDPDFVSKEILIASSKIIIIGVPHSAYRNLSLEPTKKVFDLWSLIK